MNKTISLLIRNPADGARLPFRLPGRGAVLAVLLFSCWPGTAQTERFSATSSSAEINRLVGFDCPLPHSPAKADAQDEDPQALAELLNLVGTGDATHSAPALRDFVNRHPNSRWQPALSHVLSERLQRSGRFSEAQAVRSDLAAGLATRDGQPAKELAELNRHRKLDLDLRLARTNEVEQMLQATEGQAMSASFRSLRFQAQESLHYLRTTYAQNLRCGPVALHAIQAKLGHEFTPVEDMEELGPAVLEKGLSFSDLRTIAKAHKIDLMAIQRPVGAGKLPVPAVLHWQFGHFSALLEERDGKYLLADKLIGFNGWVDLDTLTNEITGYFLVPRGRVPAGCRPVFDEEATKICGRHCAHIRQPYGQCVTDGDSTLGGDSCGGGGVGMPVYAFHTVATSLAVQDTPIAYLPPVGPALAFRLSYREMDDWPDTETQREYGHFGENWSFNYSAFVGWESSDFPNGSILWCRVPGGGTEAYAYDARTSRTTADPQSRAFLARVSGSRIDRVFPDGSKEIYSEPFRNGTFTQRLKLSAIMDPYGNQLTLAYDGNGRLTNITDTIGQKTAITYVTDLSSASDFRRIARVTDPFGRAASFQYDASGRLWRITDMGGLASDFAYATDGFLNRMTTPYGTTRFTASVGGGQHNLNRMLTATDPLGGKEVLAFVDPIPISTRDGIAPSSQVNVGGQPVSLLIGDENQHYRNTCYWDKRAYQAMLADSPENQYKYATLHHWLVQGAYEITGILESIKRPLENRVWFNYPGQTDPHFVGTSGQPSKIARVLDDGTTQLYQYEYNSLGLVTKAVDPIGRTTVFTYATNDLDLVRVEQRGLSGWERLLSVTYNAQHLPLTVTDAAGQTTTNTYNTRGQIRTVTNPLGQTTTFNYDPSGYLLSVDGPVAGTADSTSFTYDSKGRTRTVTDCEGYTLTFEYDDFGRPTKVTYPDGTFELTTYDRLHPAVFRDRVGRLTQRTYDALRRLASVKDPLDRVTRFGWCACGALESLTDPMGRTTSWFYDLQGRQIAKQYVDGSRIEYRYETALSRLKQVKDEKGQFKNLAYFVDNNLKRVSYSNAVVPTPTVSFTYDTNYNRQTSMTDGLGLSTYSYRPITAAPTLGAGLLASRDGPLPNDTASYSYDPLGRVNLQTLGNVGESFNYDPLGRVFSYTNVLGRFTNTFLRNTPLLAEVRYPNGQRTALTYWDNAHDKRLKQIETLDATAALVGRHAYAYDGSGFITNWVQALGTNPVQTHAFTYDPVGRLTTATARAGAATLASYTYGYDLMDNRLLEVSNSVTAQSAYNSLNQLLTRNPALASTNRTLEWDAEDRLTAIQDGTNRIMFGYDGAGRRVRIVAKSGSQTNSDIYYVWSGLRICEERSGTNSLQKRYFGQGWQAGSLKYFYAFDHLGSVRAVLDANGRAASSLAYTPFGALASLQGTPRPPFGYAGHFDHLPSGYLLAPWRAYDPLNGRWLSRDPVSEAGGINLYEFTLNNPINLVDPEGGSPTLVTAFIGGAMGGIIGGGVAWWQGGNIGQGVAAGAAGGFVGGLFLNPAAGWATAAGLGSFGSAVAAGAISGGAGGFASGAVGEAMTPCSESFDWGNVWLSTSMGAGLGMLGGAAYGALAPKPPLALPAPRQVAAQWSVNTYRHGGLMSAIEHINYRHAFNSGFNDASHFAANTSVGQIRGLVDDALRYGRVTPNGPNGFQVDYNIGRVIGTDRAGSAASSIRVFIRDGNIQTAFPIP